MVRMGLLPKRAGTPALRGARTPALRVAGEDARGTAAVGVGVRSPYNSRVHVGNTGCLPEE
jgi:hypothetical protein